MDSLWIETFKYHRWANQHLLEQCGRLSDEQLQLTAPGTYGTIAGTWMHLAAAEQRYVKRLGGGEPTLNERAEFPGMATVTEQLRRSDDELIELAGSTAGAVMPMMVLLGSAVPFGKRRLPKAS